MSTVIDDKEAKAFISTNVRTRMSELGLNQKQLAQATKENEMSISRVVRGLHVPSAALLHRIAEALRTSTDWLMSAPSANSRQTA